MMSIKNDNSGQMHRDSGDLLKNMINDDEAIRKSVRDFNLNCVRALNKKKEEDPNTTDFQAV
jgi:hypothetical protein